MRTYVDSALLLAPGAIAALGFYWLSSGRAAGIDPQAVVPFLLFVPLQALGLTVAKCGLDTWVLARASEWNGKRVGLVGIVTHRIAPLCLCFSCVVYCRHSLFMAACTMTSILADTFSMICANECCAHGRMRTAAVGHLFRYPLFFVLLLAATFIADVDFAMLCGAFTGTSIVRLLYFEWHRRRLEAVTVRTPGTARLGLQQVLTYGLYRNDQLAMSIISSTSTDHRLIFVYLARFPELVAAVVVALAPQWFPKLHATRRASLAGSLWHYGMQAGCGAAIVVGGAIVYRRLSPGGYTIDLSWLLAIIVHSILIAPVHYRMYSLFRSGMEERLLAATALANVCGLALCGLCVVGLSQVQPDLLWIVPMQQVVFLLFSRSIKLISASEAMLIANASHREALGVLLQKRSAKSDEAA